MESEGARHTLESLHSVPDDELLSRLGDLVSHSRRVEAELVSHIGEVDERRLYAREACPSMFAYCTQVLHLSEAEAYLRIRVARAARQYPLLLTMLSDGRLHLSGIAELVPILTPENRDVLLKQATHRSKRRILELVAEILPRPDAPSFMRRLPERRPASTPTAPPDADRAGAGRLELRPDAVETSPKPAATWTSGRCSDGAFQLGPDAVETPAIPAAPGSGASNQAHSDDHVAPASGLASSIVPSPSRPAAVEPLSPARYRVQFTASAELHDKLERLQALMRSEMPDGDLAAVIEAAVTEKLERIEARRYARTSAPRKELRDTDTSPTSRHIPAAVRRAVRERDGDRCRYVDESGRRCTERDWLEFHHRQPFGMGGDHSPGNLRLVCRSHNRHLAEHDYGRAAIQPRSGKWASGLAAPRQPGGGAQARPEVRLESCRAVALTGAVGGRAEHTPAPW